MERDDEWYSVVLDDDELELDRVRCFSVDASREVSEELEGRHVEPMEASCVLMVNENECSRQ